MTIAHIHDHASSSNGADHSSGAVSSRSPSLADPVRIRKYPNRRLYDTSRSRHLTHDGVIALVREGRTIRVTDSRSGADITNIVLLQIMIERDSAKIQALPHELIAQAMRADSAALATLGAAALRAWSPSSMGPAAESRESTALHAATPPESRFSQSREQSAMTQGRDSATVDPGGRPKAKAKRLPDA